MQPEPLADHATCPPGLIYLSTSGLFKFYNFEICKKKVALKMTRTKKIKILPQKIMAEADVGNECSKLVG